jgi:hypothetical protein
LLGFPSLAPARILTVEQLHQGSRQLFRRATGRLVFHGVPIAIADRQALQQLLGEVAGPLRPTRGTDDTTGGWGGDGARCGGLGALHWTRERRDPILAPDASC